MRLEHPFAVQRLGVLLAAGFLLTSAQPEATRADDTPALAPDDTVKVDRYTETVINGALKYLAAQQLPNGSWTGDKSNPVTGKWAVAMTSYVIYGETQNPLIRPKLEHVVLLIVHGQNPQGGWRATLDPNAKDVGTNWCTAVFTVILSLPYGYLPLYQRQLPVFLRST